MKESGAILPLVGGVEGLQSCSEFLSFDEEQRRSSRQYDQDNTRQHATKTTRLQLIFSIVKIVKVREG